MSWKSWNVLKSWKSWKMSWKSWNCCFSGQKTLTFFLSVCHMSTIYLYIEISFYYFYFSLLIDSIFQLFSCKFVLFSFFWQFYSHYLYIKLKIIVYIKFYFIKHFVWHVYFFRFLAVNDNLGLSKKSKKNISFWFFT